MGGVPIAVAARAAPPVRVSLIRPPFLSPQKGFPVGPVPPPGLAYIAGAVRAAGHHVQVIDAAGEAPEQVVEEPTAFGPIRRIGLSYEEIVDRVDRDAAVIGVSHMFVSEWPVVRALVHQLRCRFPEATIVLGGENATAFWPWIFEQTGDIDACVLGEGEVSMVTLVDRVAGGRSLVGLPGVALDPKYDDDAEPVLPDRIRDLASIARPAWDLFPLDEYFQHRNATGMDRGRSMPVLATRGCPYRCTFCSSPQMWTTRYKTRDPDDVADEIGEYVERYQLQAIDFTDLTAMTKRSWILALCDALDRRGISVAMQMPAGTRSEAFDEEVLDRLYDVGCRDLRFAPESGSPRMVDVYDKKVDLEHLLGCIRQGAARGHSITAFFMVGHPEERWRDLAATWWYLTRASIAGLDLPIMGTYHPYPGSADFQAAYERGELVPDDEYCWGVLAYRTNRARSWNPHLRPAWLLAFARWSMIRWGLLVGLLCRPNRVERLVAVVVNRPSADRRDDLHPGQGPRGVRRRLIAWSARSETRRHRERRPRSGVAGVDRAGLEPGERQQALIDDR